MGLVYNGLRYTLTCDHCGRVFRFNHNNANVMRDVAYDRKWNRLKGTEKDYCPHCKDEYEAKEQQRLRDRESCRQDSYSSLFRKQTT